MVHSYFAELTSRFVQPLNEYFESLVTYGKPIMYDHDFYSKPRIYVGSLTGLSTMPQVRAFRSDDFLKVLELNRSLLTSLSKISDFYSSQLSNSNKTTVDRVLQGFLIIS